MSPCVMPDDFSPEQAEALNSMLMALGNYDAETRKRLLKAIVAFLDVSGVYFQDERGVPDQNKARTAGEISTGHKGLQFSDRPNIAPKEFLLDKEPRTDVERVACLAYYLTHYLNTPHFKTLDVSRLNTDAAQPKFSNAAVAVDNATKMRFLVPAVKGMKQLGALGEQFVRALPDREAAKAVRSRLRTRRTKKLSKSSPTDDAE